MFRLDCPAQKIHKMFSHKGLRTPAQAAGGMRGTAAALRPEAVASAPLPIARTLAASQGHMKNHPLQSDTNTPTTTPMLVDRLEAGRLLGVSRGTIDNLRIRGELASVKIAARRLYDVADLRRFVDAKKGVCP